MSPRARLQSDHERGSGMIAVFVLVLICGALAAGVLLPSMARHREAQAHLQSIRAFHLAESGVDWAISRLRQSGGVVPGGGPETMNPQGQGSFTVTYTAGNANGVDDDGDAFIDEGDEADYVTVRSVGTSGGESRGVETLLRAAVVTPTYQSSVLINVDVPVFDSNSNALIVDGREHDVDGVVDATAPMLPGVASPAPAADLEAQINRPENFLGAGGTPSVAQVPGMDLDALVAQTTAAATMVVEPGTHSNVSWGTATPTGIEIVYCHGDLHLTGDGEGAGYLIVDGDLVITGGFTWRGVVLVRGAARMSGGGSGKRIIGALVVGEEIEAIESSTTVSLQGTVDLLYSTPAVTLANRRIAVMSVLGWYEVPVP